MPHVVVKHSLVDTLLAVSGARNDAALARELEVAPPVISKIRRGALVVGPKLILRIHEKFEMPVKSIRDLAGAQAA